MTLTRSKKSSTISGRWMRGSNARPRAFFFRDPAGGRTKSSLKGHAAAGRSRERSARYRTGSAVGLGPEFSNVRSPTPGKGTGIVRGPRIVHRGRRPDSPPDQDRARARTVRDHPSVHRREWPDGAVVHHLLSLPERHSCPPPPLSEHLLKTTP